MLTKRSTCLICCEPPVSSEVNLLQGRLLRGRWAVKVFYNGIATEDSIHVEIVSNLRGDLRIHRSACRRKKAPQRVAKRHSIIAYEWQKEIAIAQYYLDTRDHADCYSGGKLTRYRSFIPRNGKGKLLIKSLFMKLHCFFTAIATSPFVAHSLL